METSYSVEQAARRLADMQTVRQRLGRFMLHHSKTWRQWLAELQWLGEQLNPVTKDKINEITGAELLRYLYGVKQVSRYGDWLILN